MSEQVQDFVEQALQLSTVDGCVVVAAEHTETNLRWANNSLTTNGQMSSRSVTVVAVAGESAGVVTRSVSTPDELAALVKASEAAARDASPADDFAPLVEPYDTDDDWDTDPATTCSRGSRRSSGRHSSRRARTAGCCSGSPSTR
jgi:predicted Zn-dependent protease